MRETKTRVRPVKGNQINNKEKATLTTDNRSINQSILGPSIVLGSAGSGPSPLSANRESWAGGCENKAGWEERVGKGGEVWEIRETKQWGGCIQTGRVDLARKGNRNGWGRPPGQKFAD